MSPPDPRSEPWCQLQPEVRDALWAADLVTVEQIATTTIRELAKIEGVSEPAARKIRKLVPRPRKSVVPMRPGRNGGTLQTGNPQGSGRIRIEVRQACRDAFHGRISILEDIADETEASLVDRMKAIEILGRYGVGTHAETVDRVKIEDVRDLVGGLAQASEPFLRESDLERFSNAWMDVIKSHFPSIASR